MSPEVGAPRSLDVLLFFKDVLTLKIMSVYHFELTHLMDKFSDLRTYIRTLEIWNSDPTKALSFTRFALDPNSLTELRIMFIPIWQMDVFNQLLKQVGRNITQCTIITLTHVRGSYQTGSTLPLHPRVAHINLIIHAHLTDRQRLNTSGHLTFTSCPNLHSLHLNFALHANPSGDMNRALWTSHIASAASASSALRELHLSVRDYSPPHTETLTKLMSSLDWHDFSVRMQRLRNLRAIHIRFVPATSKIVFPQVSIDALLSALSPDVRKLVTISHTPAPVNVQ